MYTLFLIFFFVLGTLIGSFLNVVIYRYNSGKSIFGTRERSICFSCGKTLSWRELIPVLSFLFQKGRCTACKAKISWQYPLVEIATGVLFAALFAKYFPSNLVFGIYAYLPAKVLGEIAFLFALQLVIWSILVVITVYDFRHKIIPDGLVYAFSVLSLAVAIFFPGTVGGSVWTAIFTGVGFFCFFGGLWLVSGGRWLGFGDAKLVLGVGFLLGLVKGVSALVLAFWIGAAVSIGILGLAHLAIPLGRLRGQTKALTMKSEIPFAPFIILGTLIAFFWNIDIFGIADLLFYVQ